MCKSISIVIAFLGSFICLHGSALAEGKITSWQTQCVSVSTVNSTIPTVVDLTLNPLGSGFEFSAKATISTLGESAGFETKGSAIAFSGRPGMIVELEPFFVLSLDSIDFQREMSGTLALSGVRLSLNCSAFQVL